MVNFYVDAYDLTNCDNLKVVKLLPGAFSGVLMQFSGEINVNVVLVLEIK